MRIYVASSWRNARQPEVVERLRRAGHEVYDFRNPAPGNTGFAWRAIDGGWQSWDAATYIRALAHPVAVEGFRLDFAAMEWADAFVLVHPSGRSAHLEAGWATGKGKPVFVLLEEHGEPELMLKQVEPAGGELHADLDALVVAVDLCARRLAPAPDPAGGLLFPQPSMTREQRDAAVKAFVDAILVGVEHGGPDELWKLLGCNVHDPFTSSSDFNAHASDVADLISGLNEALGVRLPEPKPDPVDADGGGA